MYRTCKFKSLAIKRQERNENDFYFPCGDAVSLFYHRIFDAVILFNFSPGNRIESTTVQVAIYSENIGRGNVIKTQTIDVNTTLAVSYCFLLFHKNLTYTYKYFFLLSCVS